MKLADVRRIAAEWPDIVEAPHHEMLSFRVHRRIIATVPPGGDRVHIFVDEEAAQAARATNPEGCTILFWGKKFAGLAVALEKLPAPVFRRLFKIAYDRRAPRRPGRAGI